MDEKIIIKSEQYNILKICIIIFIMLSLIILIAVNDTFLYTRWHAATDTVTHTIAQGYLETFAVSIGSSLVVSALIYFWLANNSITVTDKRVYGKTVFGKRVDLPFDSVSAIGSSWLKGITVATSSGKISFLLIKNSNDIHKCVSELLIERQAKEKPTTTMIKQEVLQSNADELKKYKELLDSGIITQEEFNSKKKQILELP